MTVKELITKLETFSPDMLVVIDAEYRGGDLDPITEVDELKIYSSGEYLFYFNRSGYLKEKTVIKIL